MTAQDQTLSQKWGYFPKMILSSNRLVWKARELGWDEFFPLLDDAKKQALATLSGAMRFLRPHCAEDKLSDCEAVAMLASREASNDLAFRFLGWMRVTAECEIAVGETQFIAEEMAKFVRAHRGMIEELPAKL